MISDNNKFLLPPIVFLFVEEEIWSIGLLLYQIPAIFFIAENAEDNCIVPLLNTHGFIMDGCRKVQLCRADPVILVFC